MCGRKGKRNKRKEEICEGRKGRASGDREEEREADLLPNLLIVSSTF